MPRSARSLLTFSCLSALVLGLACSDSTAPSAVLAPGTYEFSAVLDSFTYSNSCQSSANGMQCTDTTVGAGVSKLFGTITIGDTVQGTPALAEFMTVGNLHQSDCARATTCVESVQGYNGTTQVERGGSKMQAALYGGIRLALDGDVTPGRISGRLTWNTYLGCCARQFYTGTFVATR